MSEDRKSRTICSSASDQVKGKALKPVSVDDMVCLKLISWPILSLISFVISKINSLKEWIFTVHHKCFVTQLLYFVTWLLVFELLTQVFSPKWRFSMYLYLRFFVVSVLTQCIFMCDCPINCSWF